MKQLDYQRRQPHGESESVLQYFKTLKPLQQNPKFQKNRSVRPAGQSAAPKCGNLKFLVQLLEAQILYRPTKTIDRVPKSTEQSFIKKLGLGSR